MPGSRSVTPTDVDFSVIRTSINMGHSMLDQILNGIHYGSEEVRTLLREECDFIMECKVCRNLFRSFPNFVAHKRVYCIESMEDRVKRDFGNVGNVETETVVVLPESPESAKGSTGVKKGKNKPTSNACPVKDISKDGSVLDKVVNKTYKSTSADYQLLTKAAEKMVHAKAGKITKTMTLTPIPTTSKAVIVEYNDGDVSSEKDPKVIPSNPANTTDKEELITSKADKSNKKKSSLNEMCANLLDKQAVTGMPSKVSVDSPTKSQSERSRKSVPKKVSGNASNVETNKANNGSKETPMEVDVDISEWSSSSKQDITSKGNSLKNSSSPEKMETSTVVADTDQTWVKLCDFKKLRCTECKKRFLSADSLKLHAKTIHGGRKYISKCPLCRKEFCYFSSVARHLRNVHHKPEQQIQEYKKKMNARSKFVEKITPENMAKLQSGSAEKSGIKSSPTPGWKKCDKCQKYFSKAKSYKRHLLRNCSPTVPAEDKTSGKDSPSKNSDKAVIVKNRAHDTSKSQHVYQEKELDKKSELYKALLSPSSGKSPTVVYVYPKTPVQEINTGKLKSKEKVETQGKGAGKFNTKELAEKLNKTKELAEKLNKTKELTEKQKHESKKDKNESDTGRRKIKEVSEKNHSNSVNVNDNIEIDKLRDPKKKMSKAANEKDIATTINDNDELHGRNDKQRADEGVAAATLQPVPVDDARESRSASKERHGKVISSGNVENKESPSKTRTTPLKLDPKAKVELKKLEDRLMTEAYGGSSNTSETNSETHPGLKKRQAVNDAPGAMDTNIQLKINIGQDSEKAPEKTPERKHYRRLTSSTPSPGLDSPGPLSCPTSPSSVNSMDGYSHKFKMTVQEMAELVETAGLTKFARERKKRAHSILNKKKSKEGLGGNLARPMKKSIRGKSIIPKKIYSTRFAAGSETGKIGGDGAKSIALEKRKNEKEGDVLEQKPVETLEPKLLNTKTNIPPSSVLVQDKSDRHLLGESKDHQSKKLSRELKLLENTAGFNKEGYYQSRTGSELSKGNLGEATETVNHSRVSLSCSEKYHKEALMKFREKLLDTKGLNNESPSLLNHTSPDKGADMQSKDGGPKIIEDNKTRLSRSDLHEKYVRNLPKDGLVSSHKGGKKVPSRSPSSVSDASISDKDSVASARSTRNAVALDSVSSSRDDSLERTGGLQSKKLSRELKLLENSSGFNEKGYYNTTSDPSPARDLKNKADPSPNRKADPSPNKRVPQTDHTHYKTISDEQLAVGDTREQHEGDHKTTEELQQNDGDGDKEIADNKPYKTRLSGFIVLDSEISIRKEGKEDPEGERIGMSSVLDKSEVEHTNRKSAHQSQPAKSISAQSGNQTTKDAKRRDASPVVKVVSDNAEAVISDKVQPVKEANEVSQGENTTRGLKNTEDSKSVGVDKFYKTRHSAAGSIVSDSESSIQKESRDQSVDSSSENINGPQLTRKSKSEKSQTKENSSSPYKNQSKTADSGITMAKSDADAIISSKRAEARKARDVKLDVSTDENESANTTGTTVHRTRLSTGSIFFDSELLKTSPSKFDPVERKTPDDTHTQSLDRIRKKLSLSPGKRNLFRAEEIVRQRNARFSLDTGVKQCEQCKKKFWKIKTYRNHTRRGKCGELIEQTRLSEHKKGEYKEDQTKLLDVRKKRTLSRSPRTIDNITSSDELGRKDSSSKRPRLDDKEANRPIISGNQTTDRTVWKDSKKTESLRSKAVDSNVSRGIDAANKQSNEKAIEEVKLLEKQKLTSKEMTVDNKQESVTGDNNIKPTNKGSSIVEIKHSHPSKSMNVIAGPSHSFMDDSDGESDFSGFSETDLKERDIENIDEVEDESLDQDTMEVSKNELSKTKETGAGTSVVRKANLRQKNKANPWTKKRSYSTQFRSYVCDSKKPKKMVCQITKNIDKMVDHDQLLCKYCDVKHSSVSNLRQHAIRHLGWKRYKCNLCPYTGYNRSEVKRHLTRKHSDKCSFTKVNNYVIDLKTEARRMRISKRSNTIREHRAKGISSQSSSDTYARPRPSVGRSSKRDSGETGLPMKNLMENNNQSTKEQNAPSPLSKARQRLSNVLSS